MYEISSKQAFLKQRVRFFCFKYIVMDLANIIDTSGTLPHITMGVKSLMVIAKDSYLKEKQLNLQESLRVKNIKNEKVVHFWLYMKTFHRNGTFYQYSPERLSKLTGVSPNTVRKYISILCNANWIRKHHGNITCIDRRDVQQVDKYYFRRKDYKKNISFNEFREQLILNFLNQEAKKQEYAIKTKNILTGKGAKVTASSYRKARFINKKYGMKWKEYRSKIVFSYRSLASKLNLSHSTIQSYISSLKNKGMIEIRRCLEYIFTGSYIDYINYKNYSNNNVRYINGKVWLDLGWEFSQ